ncbi:MAG: T9SS type B sorting domain-containing protein, partial [Leptolyngbya sp. SIO3F4]|nr:T9SS type B sorting domain-containing protein [Leptolyngbya sp. SIO3F4]
PATADSVVIERSINGTENFEVIDIIAYEGINEYIDNAMLEEGAIYSYRIRMADFENDLVSPYSNIASVEIGGVIVNNPPAVADINKTGKAGLEIAFQVSDFVNAFSDPDNDTLVSITILTLPENGTLFLNNTPVTQNQVINKSELNSLTFIADIDFSGVASLTYTASDGEDVAITAANIFITVTETIEPEAADLIVSATGNPLEVSLGGEINFSISMSNNGESVASNFTLEVYLSSDSVISGEDIPVFSATLDSLSPGQSLDQNQILTIPPDFPPGTYIVIFFVDAGQTVTEIDEENNISFLEITIREIVQAPVIPNIITPNGDLINDFLEIENLAQYPENTLTVLDKWGNEVFATGSYQNTWAGTDSAGQILPAGNYMIILTVLGENAATYTEVLTLIKE